eukprot:tig00001065_g6726.t1
MEVAVPYHFLSRLLDLLHPPILVNLFRKENFDEAELNGVNEVNPAMRLPDPELEILEKLVVQIDDFLAVFERQRSGAKDGQRYVEALLEHLRMSTAADRKRAVAVVEAVTAAYPELFKYLKRSFTSLELHIDARPPPAPPDGEPSPRSPAPTPASPRRPLGPRRGPGPGGEGGPPRRPRRGAAGGRRRAGAEGAGDTGPGPPDAAAAAASVAAAEAAARKAAARKMEASEKQQVARMLQVMSAFRSAAKDRRLGGDEDPYASAKPDSEKSEAELQAEAEFWAARAAAVAGVSGLLDHYYLCACLLLFAAGTAEPARLNDAYVRCFRWASELAAHFVGSSLPLFERALDFDRPVVKLHMAEMLLQGIPKDGRHDGVRALVRKTRLLDGLFSSLDIYVFPKTVLAHPGGLKSIQASHIAPHCLLTAGYDGLIRIWDANTWDCMACFSGHRSIVTRAVFTSTDAFVVSSSFDHTVRVWSARTAECVGVLEEHEDAVLCCDVAPGDRCLASGSMDRSVRLWDLQTLKCTRVLRHHRSWVKAVRFTPDGALLLSAGLDRALVAWDWQGAEGQGPLWEVSQHVDYILDLEVGEPSVLVTSSRDHFLKIGDTRTGQSKHVMRHPSSWACTLALSPDARLLACGSFDNFVLIFSVASGRLLRQMKIHNEGILAVQWARHSEALLIGTSGGALQVIKL